MLNREAAIEKVRAFASELSSIGIKLEKVILFGSYSVNRQKEYSDIDVKIPFLLLFLLFQFS